MSSRMTFEEIEKLLIRKLKISSRKFRRDYNVVYPEFQHDKEMLRESDLCEMGDELDLMKCLYKAKHGGDNL